MKQQHFTCSGFQMLLWTKRKMSYCSKIYKDDNFYRLVRVLFQYSVQENQIVSTRMELKPKSIITFPNYLSSKWADLTIKLEIQKDFLVVINLTKICNPFKFLRAFNLPGYFLHGTESKDIVLQRKIYLVSTQKASFCNNENRVTESTH